MSLQNNQLKFIETPISIILREAVVASTAIGNGIETYSVNDYILHSIFLKMTGAQEQKMKCIVWELASNDYNYRYLRYNQKPYGECSCYDEKNKIYKDLLDQITKIDPAFHIDTFFDKNAILSNIVADLDDIFEKSSLSQIRSREYNEYKLIFKSLTPDCFIVGSLSANNKNDERRIFSICDKCPKFDKKSNVRKCDNLLNLHEIYSLLYRHRNRCAHNTTSYQQNLPTFTMMSNLKYCYENYFIYFAILVLIDTIFINLFKRYQDLIELTV